MGILVGKPFIKNPLPKAPIKNPYLGKAWVFNDSCALVMRIPLFSWALSEPKFTPFVEQTLRAVVKVAGIRLSALSGDLGGLVEAF